MARKNSVAIDTVPLPERAVRVTIPVKVAFDLDSMHRVTATVLERLGCPECHSGWDLRFDVARRFQFDQDLQIRESVMGVLVTDG